MAKLTPGVHTIIVGAVAAGNFLETAAALAGVELDTAQRWIEAGAQPHSPYAAFRRDVLAAEAESERRVLTAILLAAEAGDGRAASWFLERRHSRRWSARIRQVVAAEVEGAVERVLALEPVLGREVVDAVVAAMAAEPVEPWSRPDGAATDDEEQVH
ncbi:MAG: hypothetical protein M5U28_36080 [Sandaracinaceae bacterium]|nr:hypothetical protein [Sandaracinaceae bacterium]